MNFRANTLYVGDNLPVMRGMDSGVVDLVYLDPPFNSKRQYAAPIGSAAAGQRFDDTWSWDRLDECWLGEIDEACPALGKVVEAARVCQGDDTAAYMCFMGVRLLEMRRVLKASGSIYLHCDPTASHYLKLAMDAVFGRGNFRNEIVWCYTGPSNVTRHFQRKHDTLLFYAMGKETQFHRDAVRVPYKGIGIGKGDDIFKGGDNKERVKELLKTGKVPTDWWADPFLTNVSAWRKERTGWATQKPLALLQRVIKASSNEGDVVLDPFAGCATACVAAAQLGRRWVGIEACEEGADIVGVRLSEALDALKVESMDLFDSRRMYFDLHVSRRAPKRTDVEVVKRKGGKGYRTRRNLMSLYGRQWGDCVGCGNHYRVKDFDIDHVVPRAKGGGDGLDNLQLLCGHCNSVKGSGSMEDLRVRLEAREAERVGGVL